MELGFLSDLSTLVALAEKYSSKLALYIFGSTSKGVANPNDIDLLVIYESDEDIRNFRLESEQLDLLFPLHLIAMTTAEESHYRFIHRSAARPINAVLNL